jgi:hypothetical protein
MKKVNKIVTNGIIWILTDQPMKVDSLSHCNDLTNHRSQKYVESVILKGRRTEGIQKFR